MTLEIEEDDDHDGKNIIGFTEASNVMQSILCFVMTKKYLLDRMLYGSEILQEITNKSLLKQTVQKNQKELCLF